MAMKLAITNAGHYSEFILKNGIVYEGNRMCPAPSVFRTHFVRAPIPYFQDNGAVDNGLAVK